MPRNRINHGKRVYVVPDDFPQRLELFKEASGLSWAELARRLETSRLNLRRWRAGVRPNRAHLMALLDLAESLGLLHIFTAWKSPQETSMRASWRRSRAKAASQPGKRPPGQVAGPAGPERKKGRIHRDPAL